MQSICVTVREQDAKAGRAWTDAALAAESLMPLADGQGPLAAGAAANAAAAAEEAAEAVMEQAVAAAAAAVPPTPARRSSSSHPAANGVPPLPKPYPVGPTTRSAGFRAALRDIMGGGSGSGGAGSGSPKPCPPARTRSASGSDDSAPASPQGGRQPPVAAIAKASPRYLAPNGQPRKGFAMPGMALKSTAAAPKAARTLDFCNGNSCGSAATTGDGSSWKISAAEQTTSSCS